jgi:cell division protein FtsB
MLEETYKAAQQIARDNKWDEDYANLVIFANGLSFLQGSSTLERVNRADFKADETIQRLTVELQRYTTMYAAMKYQAFLKTVDNESMDWALNALRIDNRGLKNRIDLFRADENRLRGELQRLEAENGELRAKVDELSPGLEAARAETPPTRRPSTLRGWLIRLLRQGK